MKGVFSSETKEIYLLRPTVLPRIFSSYTPNTNIQIELEERGKKSLEPNHLRILIDFETSNAIGQLCSYKYTQHVGSLEATAILAQLFIIEQEYDFRGKTRYNPPSLYTQG